MRAIRLPLLCAFAGGCLSNALLFFLWRSPESAGSPALKQHRAHHLVALAAATPDTPASELETPHVAEDGAQAASEPARSATPPADGNSEAAPAGSAVSDVLTSLEAAYRERVSARAPAEPAQAPEPATAATPPNTATAPAPAHTAAPPSAVEASPLAPAPAVEARAAAPAPAAPSTPAAPAAVAPPMAAAVAPQAPPAPAFAAEDAPPPAQIHYGDINQNTYITNIRQGDVYLIQLQQLAVLQYMQMLGASANAAPAARHGRVPPQRAFPSGIINPDNPWGFHFSPPNLVR
jgi:hypothetical protein